MAATNDAHYLRKEDAKMQSILLCIQTGKTIQDADRMEFQTDEFYVKTTDEMYELFSMVPEACANTAKIAEQCNFDFEFGHTKIPYYKAPDGMDNQAYFEKLCWTYSISSSNFCRKRESRDFRHPKIQNSHQCILEQPIL